MHLCRNIFLDKVELYRFASSLKRGLYRRYVLVNFTKFVRTPFSQNTTGRMLLVIAVPMVAKEELANKTVNYNTKTKAFEPKVYHNRQSR